MPVWLAVLYHKQLLGEEGSPFTALLNGFVTFKMMGWNRKCWAVPLLVYDLLTLGFCTSS